MSWGTFGYTEVREVCVGHGAGICRFPSRSLSPAEYIEFLESCASALDERSGFAWSVEHEGLTASTRHTEKRSCR